MEDVKKIREFLDPGRGHGSGGGRGYGFGDGSGYGSGEGIGCGGGYGSGEGSGADSGAGSGAGRGYGRGYGRGHVIKAISGCTVHEIDGVQTIIDRVRGNVAKGRILKSDLTAERCYVVKQNGLFAHGGTLRKAMEALRDKLFEGMSEDERIDAFMAEHTLGVAYPVMDLHDWHYRLTGSCEMGRNAFAADHGIDLNGEMTVEEFIRLTRNAYGGETIRQMEERYKEAGHADC